MLAVRDNLSLCLSALRAHKLRASLTMLGLTMGVATLITVMTIVQGANLYVEQKVANLGTNVFQIARTPFAVVDFTVIQKALRNKNIRDEDLQDTSLQGQTANMAEIDTRTVVNGRFFNEPEDMHSAAVCVVGDKLV